MLGKLAFTGLIDVGVKPQKVSFRRCDLPPNDLNHWKDSLESIGPSDIFGHFEDLIALIGNPDT